ncbi:MAG: DNA processing protein [Planctomycetota bacterium]|jgi:DNA processing protein
MIDEEETRTLRRLLLGLNDTQRAGSRELTEIERAFGSLGALKNPSATVLSQIRSLSASLSRALRKEGLDSRGLRVEQDVARFELKLTLFGDDDYPLGLLGLANPPLALFYRGRLPNQDRRRVAIVGSRQCTRYGARTARQLAIDLVARGVEVVSGAARGVDRAAHEGALEARGITHGILGCGLPRIYPQEHESLIKDIATSGSVICEFSPLTPPMPGNFPRRNRIIAAMCDALVLVEAKEKSGGLITTRWAADLGRSVFVLPGQVDNPSSAGCLALMRDGVGMIRNAEDLVNDLGWPHESLEDQPASQDEVKDTGPAQHLTAAERRLLACLDHEAMHLDALLPSLDQTPGQVLTALLSLELRGLVKQEPGMQFRRLTDF